MTQQNKTILSIETCTNICSVALCNGTNLHESIAEAPRSHSQLILPMIDDLLTSQQLTMADIDWLACARGPGSFTGLRIGIGVAKGLALGQNIPIIGVSPLAAIAYQTIQLHPGIKRVHAIIDARMQEIYAGEFHNTDGFPELLGDEKLTTIEDIAITTQTLFAGNGVSTYRQELLQRGANIADIIHPKASAIIKLAQRAISTQKHCNRANNFNPIYLRNRVVG